MAHINSIFLPNLILNRCHLWFSLSLLLSRTHSLPYLFFLFFNLFVFLFRIPFLYNETNFPTENYFISNDLFCSKLFLFKQHHLLGFFFIFTNFLWDILFRLCLELGLITVLFRLFSSAFFSFISTYVFLPEISFPLRLLLPKGSKHFYVTKMQRFKRLFSKDLNDLHKS